MEELRRRPKRRCVVVVSTAAESTELGGWIAGVEFVLYRRGVRLRRYPVGWVTTIASLKREARLRLYSMKIEGFVWLDQIENKLAVRHGVSIEEVEEVFQGKPQFPSFDLLKKVTEKVRMCLGND